MTFLPGMSKKKAPTQMVGALQMDEDLNNPMMPDAGTNG
jgi:hypothetical protein